MFYTHFNIPDVAPGETMYLVEKESAHFITATFSDVILGEDTTIAWNKVGGEVESDVTVNRIHITHDTQST